MATARRIKRLQQVILQTAAMYVQRELGDPRLGVVSITRVKLSPDLSHGQLFWSCLGADAEIRTTERGLEDSLASIQRAVAGALQTRTTPRLELVHDKGMVQAQHLEEIFTKLREERGEEDDPSLEEIADGETRVGNAPEDEAPEDEAPEDEAPEDDKPTEG